MSDYVPVLTATGLQKQAFHKAVEEEVSTKNGLSEEGCDIMKKFITDSNVETHGEMNDSIRREVFCAGLLPGTDSD